MEDEAEELRDGDVYEEESALSTLPQGGGMHTPQRSSNGGEVGSLLGDEFTLPQSRGKGD